MRLRHRPPYSGRFGVELAHHRRMLDAIGGREYQQPEPDPEPKPEAEPDEDDDGEQERDE
jgi:hypothetical protein